MDEEDFNFDLSGLDSGGGDYQFSGDTGTSYQPNDYFQDPQSDLASTYLNAGGDLSSEAPLPGGGDASSGSSAGNWLSMLAGGGSGLAKGLVGGGGAGGGGSSLLSTLLNLGSGIYGMTQANSLEQMAKAAIASSDPFGPQRPKYQQQLSTLMANPSSIFQDPGFKASLDQGSTAIARQMAAGGFNGSGNEAIALQQFGESSALNYLTQQEQFLAGLAGSGIGPNPGPGLSAFNSGIGQASASLGSLGYGVARAGPPGAAGSPIRPNTAGGEAATDRNNGDAALAGRATSMIANSTKGTAFGTIASEAADVFGIYSGVKKGGVGGVGQATTSAADLGAKTGMFSSNMAGVLNNLGLGAELIGGIEQGGTQGAGLAVGAAGSIAANLGLIGGEAGNVISLAGNIIGGNAAGAIRSGVAVYQGLGSQAATQVAAQAGTQAAATEAGAGVAASSTSTAGSAVAGALASAVPIFLATELVGGLVNSSTDPEAAAQRAEWSSHSHMNASLEGWLGTNGTPTIDHVSGDGSAKYPTTYTLSDGTQLGTPEWENLIGMFSRMNNPYNKGTSYTASQLQQYISSLPKGGSLAPKSTTGGPALQFAGMTPAQQSQLLAGFAQYRPGG